LEGIMRRVIRSVALSISFLLPVIAADAPSSQVLYTGKRQQPLPLSNVGDPAAVAKARLFVTVDNGKTWTLAHELQIAEGTKELPKFPFSTDHDGAFGIMPCISYRNGQSEAEPKAGQVPPYVLVVDTTAPAIAQFDATLVGRATAKAVVRFNWSVMDLNPEKEPIAIEASTDGGARFTTIHRGDLDGAVELTVPVGPETTELHLRLVATDRARNVTVSPSRNLNLAPMGDPPKPVAPLDPKEALAKAAATLPTLAEVGAGEIKPLPTNAIAPPSRENPGAPVAPKPSSTSASATAPVTAAPTAPVAAPVPEARAEVVVNGKPYVAPTTTPTTAGTPDKPEVVVADNSVDQAYYEALAASRPVTQPANPKTAPRTVLPPPPVAAPVAPPPQGDGRRAAITHTPVLVDDEVKTLSDARILATTGHLDDACDLYERLLFTSLGKTALLEDIRLLIAEKRPRDALTAITSAPLEVVTDQVRLDHGRLLLDLNRPAEVEGAVSGVGGNAPEARPALLLIAKAYLAMGRDAEAKRALEWLARSKDTVAAEARTLLGR
jgi:hypothetical protein